MHLTKVKSMHTLRQNIYKSLCQMSITPLSPWWSYKVLKSKSHTRKQFILFLGKEKKKS